MLALSYQIMTKCWTYDVVSFDTVVQPIDNLGNSHLAAERLEHSRRWKQ